MSDCLSALTLLVTAAASVVAYFAYQSSRRDAASAHMHTLFRDYLRLRFDYSIYLDSLAGRAPPKMEVQTLKHEKTDPAFDLEDVAASGAEARRDLRAQLTSSKLYALEEMYTWVQRQKALYSSFLLGRPWGTKKRKRMADLISSWERTIIVHAQFDWEEVREGLFDYMRCYSVGFLRMIADDWRGDCGLRRWVKAHEYAVAGWRPDEEEGTAFKAQIPADKPWELPACSCTDCLSALPAPRPIWKRLIWFA